MDYPDLFQFTSGLYL